MTTELEQVQGQRKEEGHFLAAMTGLTTLVAAFSAVQGYPLHMAGWGLISGACAATAKNKFNAVSSRKLDIASGSLYAAGLGLIGVGNIADGSPQGMFFGGCGVIGSAIIASATVLRARKPS